MDSVSYWFSEADGTETVLSVTESKAVAVEKKDWIIAAGGWMVDAGR